MGAFSLLLGAGTAFERRLSRMGMSVELHYAKFVDEGHTKVVFEKVGHDGGRFACLAILPLAPAAPG